jgi:hypothetical protein
LLALCLVPPASPPAVQQLLVLVLLVMYHIRARFASLLLHPRMSLVRRPRVRCELLRRKCRALARV